MLDFTENLMHSQMNLLTGSQINRKWPKIGKKQTVAEKRISTYPSCKVKVKVKTLKRNSKQGFFITF